MPFHSFIFVLGFLPLTILGYFLFGMSSNRIWPKLWLIAASLVFVATSGVQNLVLLIASVTVNCVIGAQLTKEGWSQRSRRLLFLTAIISNVAFLGYFKYAGFLIHSFNSVFGTRLFAPSSSLPLGISFYTIYQVMFLVDCYEGFVKDYSPLDYCVFAGLFPYVTMGPIVRWKQVVPQFGGPDAYRPNPDNLATALFVFAIGLFKKVVLADTFFRWADAGFSYGHPLSLVGGWMAGLAFTFELYFDFSGYTDMAIAVGLMLNIQLPQNFDAPFRAQSITEFWRRWHMTLTNFITTYLYTPMIRSMGDLTFSKAMLATFLAMVIAGLWHGANWTFVVFGALHGIALVVNQCWKRTKWPLPAFAAWFLTFVFVVISLVVFRSSNLGQATQIVSSMFSSRGGLFSYEPWMGIDRVDQLIGIGWMMFGVSILFWSPSSMNLQRKFKPSWANVALTVALAVVALLYLNGVVSRSFVYRDF
jgi:alginate O-acetyltransferase complex protein AlgI